MKTIRTKIAGNSDLYSDVPIKVIKSRFFGLLQKVKPPSVQSEVYGRKEWWVWFWQIKEFQIKESQ